MGLCQMKADGTAKSDAAEQFKHQLMDEGSQHWVVPSLGGIL